MIITIFNVGRGSSVLIQLPQTTSSSVPVGIVDCFGGVGKENLLLEKLDEISHTAGEKLTIEFLVLTHLHADHFLGVGEIIKKYHDRIMRLFDPGIDPREVMSADYKTKAPFDTKVRKDLKGIFEFKEQYPSRIFPLTTPGINIYRDIAKNLSIRSIAPEGSMMLGIDKVLRDYIRKLKKAVEKRAPLPKTGNAYDLNRTSSAIEVCYEGKRVILGGDVLNRSWKTIIGTNNLQSDVFLLSHHGASNAFPVRQWKRIHKNEMRVIISGRGYNQPSSSVLQYLRNRSTKVWVTNVPDNFRPADESHAYVAKLHYRARIASAYKQGNVICSVTSSLKVDGHRII